MTVTDTVEKIYKIVTDKKFRNGPLPDGKRKELVLTNIQSKVEKNLPIQFLQFWGGSKNINLPYEQAELCEEATLSQLARMNTEVQKVYAPGLYFHIVPGDERVQIANKIPKERTDRYVDSLRKLAQQYDGLFDVTPVSTLYSKKRDAFNTNFERVKRELTKQFEKTSNFEKLKKGARNNVCIEDKTTSSIELEAHSSALLYALVRASEEKTEIFEEFSDFIRAYFVKIIPFYEQISLYFDDVSQTKPQLDRSLFFYTGRKGNITQPWQALGKKEGDVVLFLSQTKLQ